MRYRKNLVRYVLPALVLMVLAMATLPVAGTQYEGTVPTADDHVPGAYVRYVDLEKDDKVDWSWQASHDIDFEISIPSSNETVKRERDASSKGGHLYVEHTAVYRFAWYNDDPGEDAELDYTIHQVQSVAWVLGLAALALIAVIAFAYILWYHRRRADSLGEALEDMVEETAQVPPVTGGRKVTNRAILVGVVAGLVAISVISGLYLPLEEVEAAKGSELVVTVENAANATRSVSVSVTGPGGEVLQETSLELATGQTGQVLVLASPEWADAVLDVHVDDGTGGPATDKVWTPTQGQKDGLDLVLE